MSSMTLRLFFPGDFMAVFEMLKSVATSQRILIVDDDRSSCEILSKILALRGYRVTWPLTAIRLWS